MMRESNNEREEKGRGQHKCIVVSPFAASLSVHVT